MQSPRALALLLPLLAGCGDTFVIAVDEPDLCMTLHDEAIPGAALDVQNKTFRYDLGKALPKDLDAGSADLEVHLNSFEITAVSGVENLDFLREASLGFLDAEHPDPPGVPLADWVHPEGEAVGPTIVFDVDHGVDLGDAVEKRKIDLATTMSGALPTEGWAIDARACFRVRGEIHYLE